MTTTELELLRDFFGRETGQIREDIRELRKETAREHRLLREGIRAVALRVNALENDDIADDARDEGRRQFRHDVVGRVGLIQTLCTIALAALVLIDRL